MHKSRLGTIVIDCQTDELDQAAEFWSHALGCARMPDADQADEKYVEFKAEDDELKVLVQKVNHASRVHIDIETDDIDAEIARLEKLGATSLGRIKGWCVMEAPSGHRFCVVKPQRRDFNAKANTWD